MQFKEILEGVDLWAVILWILLIFVLVAAVVKGFPFIRKFIAFVNDVAGEEARPGREARPGLFERVQGIELTQQQMAVKVNHVHHEMFPNSGKSLRDQTNRIEEKVNLDYREISSLKKSVDRLEELHGITDQKLDETLSTQTDILNAVTEAEE